MSSVPKELVVGFLAGARDFPFPKSYRLALRLSQSLIQWVPMGHFPWVKRPGREAAHLLLVPRLRPSGAVPPLPVASNASLEEKKVKLSATSQTQRGNSILGLRPHFDIRHS